MAAMDALWHRAANGRPYALVLLDARMPDADGLTVAAMIRERAELAATRIILLTSGERPGDPARFRELRIDAQLLKPVQQDELLEAIYRAMSRSQRNAPPSASPTSRQQAGTAPVPAATPLHILVAEDNELSAQVLEQALVRQGHRVRLASNGREVLTLAEQGGFDLLLLDVHMPELDGFQVVQAVRERELTAGGHLPIIALTARSRKEDRERCLAAGMDEFLTKPIRPADLLAAIDRVLRAHSSPKPAAWTCSTRRCCWPPAGATRPCSGKCARRSPRASRSILPRSGTRCVTRTRRACAKRPTNAAACSRSSRRPPAISRAAWRS